MRVPAALGRYNDFDQQAEQLSGFDQAYQQLDSGPYTGGFLACHGDEVGFFAERANRRLAEQGAGPSGTVSAVVLRDSPGQAVSNGLPFTTDDVQLVGPGGAFEAVADAGVEPVVFSLSLDSPAAVALRRLAYLHAGRIRRVTDPELARRFRGVASHILGSWDPDSESVSLPQPSVHALMFDLLTAPGAANGSSHVSIQIYRAARDVMLAALAEPLTIPEVAARVGTSRRTLEAAFDRCTSVSPARFHKLLRLNYARRLLESGHYAVSGAAAHSGFRHLGRFSADYHDLFGEQPSQTARRAKAFMSKWGGGGVIEPALAAANA